MSLVRYYPLTKRHSRASEGWRPAADVVEHENEYILSIDLPGFEKNDFNLKIDDGVLTLTGERKPEEPGNEKYYRYVERPHGRFTRSFRLPDNVDAEKINATFHDGVLELHIIKKEEAKPRTITVS